MKSQRYTLSDFENLYSQLTDSKGLEATKFISHLENMGKLLIYGDQNQSEFFQYFCEVRALDFLLEVFSKAKSKDTVIAIIGFFNMLWTNLNQKQSINYLLSHPCILGLQNIKFVALDNEVAEYYINFLKGLSRKLNPSTLHLFLNRRYPNFPLLMQTTRFYNHPEALVRTTCRNIILSCLKMSDEKIRNFGYGFPFCVYYIHQCNFLREYWNIIDNVLTMDGDRQFEMQNLDNVTQDHQEILMFMEDFMRIDHKITESIVNAFANQCMAPLIQSLTRPNQINFSLKTTLYVFIILLKTIDNKYFKQFIVVSLLGKYYSNAFSLKLLSPVERPISYCKQWKFKGFWDSHQNSVSEYCVGQYFPQEKSIIGDKKLLLAQNEDKSDKVEKRYSSEVRHIFGMGTNFFDRQSEKLENIFAIPIKSDKKQFKKKSTAKIFNELKEQALTSELNMHNYCENPARANILAYLKSKDDTLVMLTLNLLITVLRDQSISEEILSFCCLTISPKSQDFRSMIDIQSIIKSCMEIFVLDPPPFRICTYKACAELLGVLCPVFKGEFNKIPKEIVGICKTALKTHVEKVEKYLFSGKNWVEYIEIFNKITNENDKKKPKMTMFTYGLLQRQVAEIHKLENHEIFQIQPQNQPQLISRDFWLYMIVRDVFCNLTKINYKFDIKYHNEQSSQKQQNEKSYKNHFKFQIGMPYEIDENHEIHAKYKKQNSEKFENCSLIFLGEFIVVTEGERVRYKSGYQESLIVMDRSDPRKIFLQMGNQIFIVEFQNAKSAYDVRRHFEDMKKTLYKSQLSILVKQTQWMLEQVKGMQ